METRLINVRVKGVTPLMMHNPAQLMQSAGRGQRTGAKSVPLPEHEAELGTYRMADGTFCVPAEAVRNAIIAASAQFVVKGRKTWKTRVAPAVWVVPRDWIPLLEADEARPLTEYVVDVRRCVLTGVTGRPAVMRARPRFDTWGLQFKIEYDTSMFPDSVEAEEALYKILELAGREVGILEYRPSKGGWYGRFVIEEFEMVAKP